MVLVGFQYEPRTFRCKQSLNKEEQDILIHMKNPGKFKGLLNGVDVRNET